MILYAGNGYVRTAKSPSRYLRADAGLGSQPEAREARNGLQKNSAWTHVFSHHPDRMLLLS